MRTRHNRRGRKKKIEEEGGTTQKGVGFEIVGQNVERKGIVDKGIGGKSDLAWLWRKYEVFI